MKKEITKHLTINDLDRIIKNYYKLKSAFITQCEVGTVSEQYDTKRKYLGAGAVLTLTVECIK